MEKANSIRRVLSRYGIYFLLLGLIVTSGIIRPVFLQPASIFNLLLIAAPLAIVAIGQLFVILGGGFDLSVGSVMGTTNIIAAALMYGRGEMCVPISLLCLGLGSLVGLVNGVLIAKRNISPFIMTLGMMIFLRGVRFVWTKGAPYGTIPDLLRFLGTGTILNIPTSLIIWIGVGVLSAIILYSHTYGRKLYAVGGNKAATRLSGINVDRVIIWSYIISGFLAAFAGLVLTGYLGLADAWAGKGYELSSIAAVVIGGAHLGGGKGTVEGTVVGVLVISILDSMVLFLGLPVDFQLIVKGAVILAMVASYSTKKSV